MGSTHNFFRILRKVTSYDLNDIYFVGGSHYQDWYVTNSNWDSSSAGTGNNFTLYNYSNTTIYATIRGRTLSTTNQEASAFAGVNFSTGATTFDLGVLRYSATTPVYNGASGQHFVNANDSFNGQVWANQEWTINNNGAVAFYINPTYYGQNSEAVQWTVTYRLAGESITVNREAPVYENIPS